MRHGGIRVRDFEGHVVELDGFAAAFVDDQRMLPAGAAPAPEPGIELSEVRPFSSPTPLWSRRIAELGHASVEIDPDGKTIALTGSSPEGPRTVVVRTGFGRDAPLRVVAIPSLHQDADGGVGLFFAPDGEAGSVVSRERAAGGASGAGAPSCRPTSVTGTATTWSSGRCGPRGNPARRPSAEPHLLWVDRRAPVALVHGGVGGEPRLPKIDAVAGRVSRVADALPKRGSVELIAPSKLAVVSYVERGMADRLGVVDLETRQGTWLTLPTAGAPRSRPPTKAPAPRASYRSKAGWRRSSTRARVRTRR